MCAVRKVIAELLGASIDSVRDDADFVDDLGADSLDCLELVMGLEKEFGIEIPDEDVEKLKTLRQMVEYVAGCLCEAIGSEDSYSNAGL